MPDFRIVVRGLDKLTTALGQFPDAIKTNLAAAGKEAAETVVLDTEGLRRYPPATDANAPPYPYYIRGRGTQTSEGHNNLKSERLGTRFYVRSEVGGAGLVRTTIGNNASYAKWVVGEQQAGHMKPLGWRQIGDVVRLKAEQIKQVFENWVTYTLKQLGLQ